MLGKWCLNKIVAKSRLSSQHYFSSIHAKPLFDKILIANRGEIACRIIKTAKKLGIQTVAVYSDADAHAEHVKAADEAVYLGPSPATESYLRGNKIVEACIKTGAKAIHPGYGFLSENLPFCELITKAGLIFIGPPPKAIKAMGSKSESKDIMIKAGVPVTPGYHGKDNSNDFLLQKAREIGWPLMIKAVSGGGGKGMRAVFEESKFIESLESCRREALKSFGDEEVLLEKLIQAPRHVELQVFGDLFGNAVHLAERDCSIQRRHQKVLEEAPAPGLDPKTRAAMGEAAVACVKAVGYVGAGTVEFLIDSVTNDFYFCEMNTRLQVEHPVTEMITGTDLVEWQLRVASGQPLPLKQEEILAQIKGCAIEARVYAENPLKDFLPGSGYLAHIRTPVELPGYEEGVRVDSGVIPGNNVSTFYDPMIAKLIVHAESRELALGKLERALRNYQVAGLANNIDFLIKVVRHRGFAKEQGTTAFFSKYMTEILDSLKQAPVHTLPTAALFGAVTYLQSLKGRESTVWNGNAEFSNWRNATKSVNRVLKIKDGKESVDIVVDATKEGKYRLSPATQEEHPEKMKHPNVHKDCVLRSSRIVREAVSDRNVRVSVLEGVMEVGGLLLSGTTAVQSYSDGSVSVDVWINGETGENSTHYQFFIQNPAEGKLGAGGSSNPILFSPMPGKIVKVLVGEGAEVKQGQAIVILEAMKMEHIVSAPSDGKVTIFCNEGATVSEGSKLAEVNKAKSTSL